jgi:hypothetical protein
VLRDELEYVKKHSTEESGALEAENASLHEELAKARAEVQSLKQRIVYWNTPENYGSGMVRKWQ